MNRERKSDLTADMRCCSHASPADDAVCHDPLSRAHEAGADSEIPKPVPHNLEGFSRKRQRLTSKGTTGPRKRMAAPLSLVAVRRKLKPVLNDQPPPTELATLHEKSTDGTTRASTLPQ
jgi:hypothetical protein